MDYSNIDKVVEDIIEKLHFEHNLEGAVKMVADAPEGLRNDKNFFRKLRMRLSHGFIHFCKCIGEELSNDEEFILEMAQGEGHNLSCASEQLRGNREFMERACTVIDPRYVVDNASTELQGNKEFILMALDNTDEGWAIIGADEKLFDDEDIRQVISGKYDGQRVIARMEEMKEETKRREQLQQKKAERDLLQAKEQEYKDLEGAIDSLSQKKGEQK